MNEATSDYIWINDELNNFNQIIPRRYTLVHDPNISDLFLYINHEFMYQHLISSEFKLLGEWITYDEKKYLYYIYIDVYFIHPTKNLNPIDALIAELPRLIKAIKYGDCSFFSQHEQLLDSSIYLFLHSKDPTLDCIKYVGLFSDYI